MIALPPSRVKRPTVSVAPQSVMDSATGKYVTKTVSGDTLLRLGERTSGVAVVGGTRVVVQGGQISLTQPGPLKNGKWDLAQLAYYRRALTLNNQTDTDSSVVHVEGLHATGPCLSEGAQSVTSALVQYVYCRFDHLIEQDPAGDTDNHSDMVQAMRADRGVRISWCAAVTDMQGFMLKWESYGKPYALLEIDNTLYHGGDHAEILLNLVVGYYNQMSSLRPRRLENVSLVPSREKLAKWGTLEAALGHSVAPSIDSAADPAKVVFNNTLGLWHVRWPSLEPTKVEQVDRGVYCDPTLLDLTPAQCLERHLPASLIGANYTPV